MEDSPTLTSSETAWAHEVALALGRQRGQIRDFLASQRARLDQVQTQLAEQIETIHEATNRDCAETARAQQEIEIRSERVHSQLETLTQLKLELDARQARWEDSHHEAIGQYETLANQFRHQQEAQVAELSSQLQLQIDEQHRRAEQQAVGLQDTVTDQKEFHAELEAARHRETELRKQYDELRKQYDELDKSRREAAQAAEIDGIDAERLESLEQERGALSEKLRQAQREQAELTDQLAEAQRQVAQASTDQDTSRDDDMERRYEMALEDLRELQAENQDLQQKLDAAPSAKLAPAASGPILDWEAEKQRILDALESDFDETDADAQAERLKVEKVVARTDKILAEKDREIFELQQLLESQSATHDGVAVGAAALGEILDQDAVIQDERDKLYQLQRDWEEKLRQAELEVSVERAKLARERSELEEQIRVSEERTAQANHDDSSRNVNNDAPQRGRWLARLGIKESSE